MGRVGPPRLAPELYAHHDLAAVVDEAALVYAFGAHALRIIAATGAEAPALFQATKAAEPGLRPSFAAIGSFF